MKILSLHCDYLKFKPLKKALKTAELKEGEDKLVEVQDPLGIFIAIEKQDESNKKIVDELVENVLDLKDKVRADRVVLYPYAHLSSSLSDPKFAQETLEAAEAALKKKKIETYRAPFGYYKEFELKCKGHPLAELSRQIGEKPEIVSKDIKEDKEEKYDAKQLLNQLSKTVLNKEKLKENDHRILGQEMDLFSFSPVAPGMVFWHDKGLIIRDELINYWKDEHRKEDYKLIKTPQILDKKLWQISGHWEKYKENIFLTEYEKRQFAVKPMNCPGGMLVYKHTPKSYKEFPLRVAELGEVHRQELSGVLGGLFRVIQFTQDDAHIYCTEKQMSDEIARIIDMALSFYKKFNLKLDHVELSTRPEKRIGEEKMWDLAEETLEKVLKKSKVKFVVNKGDGAFYGPKIDFHVKDSLDRTWQCATIQLDFAMPERFDLVYKDKDGKDKRPVMIHRTIYGSLERFMGVLLEDKNGRLPTWLSPIQVKLISFTDNNINAVEAYATELKEQGVRVEVNTEAAPMGGRIRDAENQKIPYIIVIGDKEEKAKELAVRKEGKVKNQKKDEFTKKLLEEIKERK